MLNEDFSITFVCREIPEKMESVITNQSFGLKRIQDEETFIQQLTNEDCLVLDGYHFDGEYQKQARNTGVTLVCLDDIHKREFFADLIINHAPDVTPDDYQALPDTRFALGPEYALLRPVFLEQAKKERKIDSADSVLICFGGSDFRNLTVQTLRTVLDFEQFRKITIIAGSAYKYQGSLERMLRLNAGTEKEIRHYYAVNEQQMLSLMLETDVAIVPSSGILFETLAAGNKIISGMYTDNQLRIYSGFRKLEAFIDAGSFQPEEINIALERVSEFTPPKLIDGQSGQRIRKLFQGIGNR